MTFSYEVIERKRLEAEAIAWKNRTSNMLCLGIEIISRANKNSNDWGNFSKHAFAWMKERKSWHDTSLDYEDCY
jgi:hypothetical protein